MIGIYLPNPSALGHVTRSQFWSGGHLVWIQSFLSTILVAILRLKGSVCSFIYHIRTDEFIHFQRALVQSERQTVSFWSLVTDSLSFNNNRYDKFTLFFVPVSVIPTNTFTKYATIIKKDNLYYFDILGIPNSMLSIIISFHRGMKSAVVSGGKVSEPFGGFHWNKAGLCLFALYFSVMLQYAYAGSTWGFHFQFRTSGGRFNHHRFNHHRVRSSIIHDLLFADDAALVVASL